MLAKGWTVPRQAPLVCVGLCCEGPNRLRQQVRNSRMHAAGLTNSRMHAAGQTGGELGADFIYPVSAVLEKPGSASFSVGSLMRTVSGVRNLQHHRHGWGGGRGWIVFIKTNNDLSLL